MRCLPAMWSPDNWYFYTLFGGNSAFATFFAVGCIPAAAILIFLLLGWNRIALVVAALGIICAVALIVIWAQDCAHWLSAPLPTDCGKEACDNDGAIRLSLAIGGAMLPLTLPLFLASAFSFIIALRRIRHVSLSLN